MTTYTPRSTRCRQCVATVQAVNDAAKGADSQPGPRDFRAEVAREGRRYVAWRAAFDTAVQHAHVLSGSGGPVVTRAQLCCLAEVAKWYTLTELHDAITWYQARGYGVAAAILRLELEDRNGCHA